MINNLCIDNKVETAFNLISVFKKFVNEQSRQGMAIVVNYEVNSFMEHASGLVVMRRDSG